ncbi:MAG TPA: thioesterase family protein [Steroidobacteraceae bacterium]|jgi:acyl-CoA thioester hydrolase
MRKQGVIDATVEAVVAFHDVDVAGVAWHGHYLKYLENARWALMQRLDFGLDAMIASGYAWPIVEAHVKYVRVARFGDRLTVQASLVEWQNRLTVHYLVTNAATTERVARAKTVQVAVEASSGVLQFATPAVLLERVAAATRGV